MQTYPLVQKGDLICLYYIFTTEHQSKYLKWGMKKCMYDAIVEFWILIIFLIFVSGE